MIAFIAISGLIDVCPEDQGKYGTIHLLIDNCLSHNCHKSETDSECSKEICDHKVCNDQALFDSFLVPQKNQTASNLLLTAHIPAYFTPTFKPEKSSHYPYRIHHQFTPPIPQTTILRI